MPDVGVIIPTRDRREMALRAIRSALAQTRPPKEIFLVDDGSQDGTAEAAAALANDHLIVVRQDAAGAAHARNNGIRRSTCEWIAFLDSDDEWLPQKLEKQLAVAEREPAVVLIFSDAYFAEGDEVPGSDDTIFSRQPPSSGHIFAPLLLDNFIITSTAMARRDALLKTPLFADRFRPAEDYDLWLRLARMGPCTFHPEPLAVYRRHPGQTGRNLSVMFPKCVEVIEAALRDAGLQTRDVPGLRKRLSRLHNAAKSLRPIRLFT